MPRIDPEGRLTRAERLATVVAVIGAVLVHVVALFGWGSVFRWAKEEEKKERLMVIRRVRDIAPPRELIPAPQRPSEAPASAQGRAPGDRPAPSPPPRDPKVLEEGPKPPKQNEISPKMEEELQQALPEQPRTVETGDNSVSVVTDLAGASFIVNGPSEYRGAGTYWVRKGAPPGTYTVTFNPVAGFSTPPVQTKELAANGQIVFLGKYRKSVEVVVESNVPTAEVAIFRPGGRQLEITGVGSALFEDLVPGAYTAVFQPVPGHAAPPPVVQTLAPGAARLIFRGEYRSSGPVAASSGARTSAPTARGGESAGGAAMSGRAAGRAGKGAPAPQESGLDRRVQMVVESYPPTDIKQDYDPIPYPEVIIRKSNFQQGWCQVYLIVSVDDRGDVERVDVERPRAGERTRFEALIGRVEAAVRGWDYDKVKAEVHVDVRFYVE